LEKQYPQTNRQLGSVVVPMAEQMTGATRMSLVVLFCASGFVLLIACANIANLLLARAAGRTREVAVRAALGAGRGVIVRQLLTESVLLAVLGASAGLLLARGAMLVLEKMIPVDMAGIPLAIDWRMLAFTAAVTLTTGLLFGLFPALSLGRVELAESLKEGSRTSSAARHKLRDALVVSQTGLALALLTGAALMIQTLYHLQNVDLGMRTDGLLTLSTDLPRSRYPDHVKREPFFHNVLDKVRNIPGVISAGYTSDLPLTAMGNTNGYILEGQTAGEALGQDALNRVVTAGFFETMGSRIREGRFFADSDTASTQRVAIVNETFADRHWPGQSALGKRIDNSGSREQRNWQTVVGVIKEIRERGITLETKPAIYTPLRQAASNWAAPSDLAIRTAVDPLSIASAVRHAVAEVDKDQPVYQMRTMNEVVDSELAGQQQQMTLLTAFALIAVLLAGTGIYGVISYLVSQRRREIGVRMALGASPSEIVALVLRRGVVLIGGGLLLGLALSALASRLIGTLLFGVKPYDPLTLFIAAAFLACAGLAACAAPARWAARLDPARVLRDE
jgi:predicted permease